MQKLLMRPKRLRNTTGKQEDKQGAQFAQVIYMKPLGKRSRLGNELRFIRLSGYTHIVNNGQLHNVNDLLKQFAPHLV